MKPIYSNMRSLAIACMAALLGACGGGGDSGGQNGNNPPAGPPPTNPPATSAPRLVPATTQMNAQATIGNVAVTRSIALTIENPPESGGIHVGGTYSTIGIQTASINMQGPGGSLVVNFRNPAALGPGTYTDTITLRACTETPCVNHIAGSPQLVFVTYTVAGAPGNPDNIAVTYSTSSVTVSGDNLLSHASFKDRSIAVTVANPPPGGLWIRSTTTDRVVTSAAVIWPEWPSVAQGFLELTIRSPSTLGAGSHADSVQVELCMDAPCTQVVPGSQATFAVTYNVTGSANPTITVHWSQGRITDAELITTETRAPKLTLRLLPSEAVYAGVYALHGDSATGLITHVVETSIAHGSQTNTTFGNYDIYLRPPASLGSGTFTDTMQFQACFDPACTNPVPNSTYTVSVHIVVVASEDVDFTRQVLAAPGARDVVWSEANQLLYVSTASAGEHRLTQLNPQTMEAITGPALGAQNLQRMTITPDGSYLYAGSASEPFVYRFALPALQPELQVFLGNSGLSTPYTANDLQTVPGQPRSFVVAIKGYNDSNAGVYVFDDATARPNWVQKLPTQTFEQARWLLPAATPGTFISQLFGQSFPQVNSYDQLTIDAHGISTTMSTPTGHQFFFSRPTRAAEKLFTTNGKVLDAATGAILDEVPGLGTTVPYVTMADETRGRLYVWTELNQREVIFVYDLATLSRLAIVPVYGPSQQGGFLNKSMALWGNNGLALTNGSQVVVFSGAAFAN